MCHTFLCLSFFACHSERSEKSLLLKYMRPFTEFILSGIEGFRVTTIIKELVDELRSHVGLLTHDTKKQKKLRGVVIHG